MSLLATVPAPSETQAAEARLHSSADLVPETFAAWLRTMRSTDGDGAVRINGTRLSETQTRQVYRWEHEGAHPSFFSADAFAVAVGRHINEFLVDFAAERGLPVWASGEPPAFETTALDDDPTGWAEVRAAWPVTDEDHVAELALAA